MFVDRFLHTAMFYPGNYGFIPQTLSQDGDPCDVLVIAPVAVASGSVIRCRPVGALLMEDQAGTDEKIIAVPVDDLHPYYTDISSYLDLPKIMREQIAHFFQHYKTSNETNGRASANGSAWKILNASLWKVFNALRIVEHPIRQA